MRSNQTKEKILALLAKKHLLSMSDIQAEFSGVDFSTIFRNIEQLEKEGKVKAILIDNKITRYELSHEQHAHFICNNCGKIDSVHEEIRLPKKLKVTDVTLRGVCGNC